MSCPRCAGPFTHEPAGNATIRSCEGCGGIWLDVIASADLLAGSPGASTRIASERDAVTRPRVVGKASGSCPDCERPLARRRFGWSNGQFRPVEGNAVSREGFFVDVDVCAEHGTFFDRGELLPVAGAIAREQASAGDRDPRPAGPPAAPGWGEAAVEALGIVASLGALAALTVLGAGGDDD